MMHEGQTGPAVTLAEAVAAPHTYAVGALAGLRGEVTVVDGRVWRATAGEAPGAVRVEEGAGAGAAALLVAAQVPRWQEVVLPEDVGGEALVARLEALAARAGLDLEQPFPLLLSGPLAEVDWHVVDGRRLEPGAGHAAHRASGASGTLRGGEGVLVGFYSRHHAGVFTHMGERLHLHLVAPASPAPGAGSPVTGHADRVVLRAGTLLRLPAPAPAP
jgi:acetolactate decarboxylase